jgi:hypothetical protein
MIFNGYKWILGHILGAAPGALVILAPTLSLTGLQLIHGQSSPGAAILEFILTTIMMFSWLVLLGLGAVVGVGVGAGQWWALPKNRPEAGQPLYGASWVAASAVGGVLPGWLLVFVAVLGASNGGNEPTDIGAYIGGVALGAAMIGGVAGAICGAVVGGIQWFILSRAQGGISMGYGLAWLAATSLGWGASWAIFGGATGLMYTFSIASGLLLPVMIVCGLTGLFGSWACLGVLTGFILKRLNPKPALQLAIS